MRGDSGGSGYAIGDFIGGVIQNHRNARAAREVSEAVDVLRGRSDEMESMAIQHAQWAASYLATLRVLRRALVEADPDHPLLKEGALAAVEAAGARAFTNGTPGRKLYDARDCGDALPLPQRSADAPPAPRQALAAATARLKQAEAQLLDLKRENERLAAENLRLGAARSHMIDAVSEMADKFNLDLQENRSERIGYREALRILSPDHPLLSPELRGRLRRAANLAFTFEAGNIDRDAKWRAMDAAVVEFVREQVPEPPPTPRELHLTSEAQQVIEMVDNDLVDHRSQRTVFRSELARLHPTHPLVTDVELRSAVSRIGGMAYALSNGPDRWSAVDAAAYEHFVKASAGLAALQLINARMGIDGPFLVGASTGALGGSRSGVAGAESSADAADHDDQEDHPDHQLLDQHVETHPSGAGENDDDVWQSLFSEHPSDPNDPDALEHILALEDAHRSSAAAGDGDLCEGSQDPSADQTDFVA